MIDLEYSCYITELLMDHTLNEELRSRRFDAIRRVRGLVARYEEDGFLPELVETVFCKNMLRMKQGMKQHKSIIETKNEMW